MSLALIPALSGVGDAAYFKMDTEIGPQEATEAPAELESCNAEGRSDADASISPDGQQVRVFASTSSTVQGTNCTDQSANASAAAVANGTIQSDTGEVGPVTICVSASVSQTVSSSGTGYKAASAADAIADISSIGLIYDYPGTGSDVQRFEVDIMIGDDVAAAVAAVTAAIGGPGEGSASASNRGEIIMSIGPCSAAMAPTMGATASATLAIALGLLGAAMAGKRRHT